MQENQLLVKICLPGDSTPAQIFMVTKSSLGQKQRRHQSKQLCYGSPHAQHQGAHPSSRHLCHCSAGPFSPLLSPTPDPKRHKHVQNNRLHNPLHICTPLHIYKCISQRHPALPTSLPTPLLPVGSHHANCWSDEKPAVFDDGPWPVADHVFNVIIETLSTCRRREGCLTATREQGQQGLCVPGKMASGVPASPPFGSSPEDEAVTSA